MFERSGNIFSVEIYESELRRFSEALGSIILGDEADMKVIREMRARLKSILLGKPCKGPDALAVPKKEK